MTENKMNVISQTLLSTGKLDYRPCLTCRRHPSYPEIPAVTLHNGDVCLVCREKEKRKQIEEIAIPQR